MKKSILTTIFLCAASGLSAQLKQDPKTSRYYSIPNAREINQNDYHQLVWACKDILRNHERQHSAFFAKYPDLRRSSGYNLSLKAGNEAVMQYLQRIATPTSMRLLADLQERNFGI